jgi:hypothetical protein
VVASRTCGASASGCVYTAMVSMPCCLQVRMMRRAISPRLAISTRGAGCWIDSERPSSSPVGAAVVDGGAATVAAWVGGGAAAVKHVVRRVTGTAAAAGGSAGVLCGHRGEMACAALSWREGAAHGSCAAPHGRARSLRSPGPARVSRARPPKREVAPVAIVIALGFASCWLPVLDSAGTLAGFACWRLAVRKRKIRQVATGVGGGVSW